MRPGQNKRLRGRNHNRKGPNPLTRSYESNGPDVKVRGTAQHIAEKYLQLARDAQSSGDPVMAESYLQHAEHYYRLIAAAQQAQQQAMGFGGRSAPEVEVEDDEDDYVSDRFASVAERLPQPAAPNGQPFGNQGPGAQSSGGQPLMGGQNGPAMNGSPNGGGQGGGERPSYQGGQPFQGGEQQQRQPYGGERGPRPWRQDGRQEGRQDNNRGDNNYERGDRGEGRGNFGGGDFNQGARPDGRRFRDAPRPEQAVPVEDATGGLPAFITGSRPADSTQAGPAASEGDAPPPPAAEVNEGQGYHLRPRRRRRGRPGAGPEEGFGEEGFSAPEGLPASE